MSVWKGCCDVNSCGSSYRPGTSVHGREGYSTVTILVVIKMFTLLQFAISHCWDLWLLSPTFWFKSKQFYPEGPRQIECPLCGAAALKFVLTVCVRLCQQLKRICRNVDRQICINDCFNVNKHINFCEFNWDQRKQRLFFCNMWLFIIIV